MEALIIQQTSPEDAYKKFDDLAKKHVDSLRKLTKNLQDAKMGRDENEIKKAVKVREPITIIIFSLPLQYTQISFLNYLFPKEYDGALEKYIPVLMGQAKIYWDMENYAQVNIYVMKLHILRGLKYFLFYFIPLFYSILFYSILFYSILFYSILFYSVLLYSFLIQGGENLQTIYRVL